MLPMNLQTLLVNPNLKDITAPSMIFITITSHQLRIQDVYPGSELFHPRSRVKKIPDPGSRIRISIKKFEYF
jgi:hypothetical protein